MAIVKTAVVRTLDNDTLKASIDRTFMGLGQPDAKTGCIKVEGFSGIVDKEKWDEFVSDVEQLWDAKP